MAGIVEDQLSESEFRAKLYNTLQKKGVLNSLKCQLRNLMVKELQQSPGATGPPPPPAVVDNGGGLLLLQVANSITISHLSQNGYEYSVSTFLPEAGVNEASVLTSGDIIHFLHLPGHHPIATSLINSNRGLLLPLLEGVSSLQSSDSGSTSSVAIQTEVVKGEKQRIEEEEDVGVACLEGRMLAIQKECESRSKRTLDFEMKRFKQKELSMMRMEERNKYLKEVSKAKEQLELQYKEKLALSNRSLEDERGRLRRREAELEEGLFTQRQALLEEMEVLKLRESEIKKQAELNRRTAALEQEKVGSLQDLLTSKDNLIADIKSHYEQMVEARVERCVAEMQTKHVYELQKLEQLEKELQVQKMANTDFDSCCEKLTNELSEERLANQSLNQQLADAAGRQNELLRKIELLEDKLRHVSDCSVTSRKKEALEERKDNERTMRHAAEVTKMEGKITELEDTVSRLKCDYASKSQEHNGLEQLIIKGNQERMSLQYDNRQLHRELTLKTESCLQLQQGYDQQTIVLRSAYREIEDLQEQVGHLHQLLVGGGGGGRGVQSPGREKAKVKKKRSSPAKNSLVHFSSSDSSSPLFNETGRSFRLFAGSPDSRPFSDTSAQLLAEARATFLRLENEAKELEKSYSLRKPQATSLFSAPASSSTLSSPIGTITATATRSLLLSESSPDTPSAITGVKQPPRITLMTPPLSVSHSTTVTTPTQHNDTPLLSTGHQSLSDQSTQIISSDHTSPREESGSLGPSPDIGPVRLDEGKRLRSRRRGV